MSLCPICRTELHVGESECYFECEETGVQFSSTLIARWCDCGEYDKIRRVD